MNTIISDIMQRYKKVMQKNSEKRALVAEMLRKGASSREIVSAAQVSFNLVAEVRRELARQQEASATHMPDSAIESATDSTAVNATDSAIDSSTAEPVQHSEQSYLSSVRHCISGSAAELLLFRKKRVERSGLIALTRALSDCAGHFAQYLALKGTLETVYSRRVGKLLDLLRHALADNAPLIGYEICRTAQLLAEAPLVSTPEKPLCTAEDFAAVLAYRPPAVVRLQEAIPQEEIRLACAKAKGYGILSAKKVR